MGEIRVPEPIANAGSAIEVSGDQRERDLVSCGHQVGTPGGPALLRPDFAAMQRHFGDHRSQERLRAHYVLEKALARRLRHACPADRVRVYREVYAELFRSLPDHPQRRVTDAVRERRVRRMLTLLMPLLGPDKVFLEIGCGDAKLSSAVARRVAHSYALDVTDALIARETIPQNMEVLITSGTDIPLPNASVDVALSDQLMEHLHPEDALVQLREVFRVLRPGGAYCCITPNRFTGPHDISAFFDYKATGFHLQEYCSRSLSSALQKAGFRRVDFVVLTGRFRLPFASSFLRCLETALQTVPDGLRAWSARRRPIGFVAGLNALAVK